MSTAEITPAPRIFVQIPSYRDRECQWTVKDLFDKADQPDRVFVAICWQFNPDEDADCFLVEPPRPAQVRRADYLASEARGLGWARAEAQALWQGEEYTLQIDSHMRFVPGWDTVMLSELAACPSDKAVLTVYPAGYLPPDHLQKDIDSVNWAQAVFAFASDWLLQYTSQSIPSEVPRELTKPTAGLAGGFVFGPSQMFIDVPSDPDVYFHGEEPNLAVRLFTHGYDLFSPRVMPLYHYYLRMDGRRIWDDANFDLPNARTLERMRRLFEPRPGDEPLGRFGLGSVRSLEEYELFAGVDFRARSVASFVFHFPFVYSDEVTTVLIAMHPLEPASGARLFVLGDEGVLFSLRTKSFYRLTPLATFCWCAMESGSTVADMIEAVAERAGLSEGAARQRVHSQICHWQNQGVLREGERSAPGARYVAPKTPPVQIWPPLPPHDITPVVLWYRLLDSTLALICYGDTLASIARAVFGHLEALVPQADGQASQTIQMMSVGNHHFVVLNDRYPPHFTTSIAALGGILLGLMDDIISHIPSSLLHVWAGLVEGPGGATLIIASDDELRRMIAALSRSIAGCTGGPAEAAARAHPGLINNPLVQISQDRGLARAVARPLMIPESWYGRAIPSLPDAAETMLLEGFECGQGRIAAFARPPSHDGLVVTRLLAVLVDPATNAATLDPLSAPDALTAVLRASAPNPFPASVEAAALLAGWIERVPCFRLTAPSIEAAIAAV